MNARQRGSWLGEWGLSECPSALISSSIHAFLPCESPYRTGGEVGGEDRPTGTREGAAAATALRGGPAQVSSWQPQSAPEACCGGDLSLLSPVPLLPPPWLYKTVITKSGTQLLPSFHRSVSGPVLGAGARGPAHFWIEMALRGLGIQREPSQQGPPVPGSRQVPGINIYFLTSWC